ncbi:hypothetical protein ACQY1X_12000 [Microcystis protocystis FBCC-A270]|uniref:hypothetical protein n=1 Tax=Microcystis protocystis TaxID=629747 RepID=UPI003D2E9507
MLPSPANPGYESLLAKNMAKFSTVVKDFYISYFAIFIAKLKYLLNSNLSGSSRFCVISLTYIGSIFVSSVSGVVPSTPSPAGLYLRIHFTHQIQESPFPYINKARITKREKIKNTSIKETPLDE